MRTSVILAAFGLAIAALPRGGLSAAVSGADGAYLVRNGLLLRVQTDATERDRVVGSHAVPIGHPVHEFLGRLPGNRLVASLGTPERLGSLIHQRGVDVAILSADGAVDSVVAENAVRAYPSPDGSKIAVIDIDYSLLIREDGSRHNVPIPGRTVLAAWSPDGGKLCVTAYPEDWSPQALSNPDSPEELLRLLNSDLYIVDVATGGIDRLTDHPASDYGAVFSPDGRQVVFISTRSGHHAFHLADLATREIRQVTNRDRYAVPIARSDTITWLGSGDEIVYESQEDMTTNGIRSLRVDGTDPRLLGTGRQPQVTAGGQRVFFLGDDGNVRSADVGP
jgi:dipeptidyl aminopeptidase/acylaminoacyl peptidase